MSLTIIGDRFIGDVACSCGKGDGGYFEPCCEAHEKEYVAYLEDLRATHDPKYILPVMGERRELALPPDASICPACATGCHEAPEGLGPFKCDCGCHGRE